MMSSSLAEIRPNFLSFFSSRLVMEEASQSHWGSLVEALDLRVTVGALEPVALVAAPEDAAILFLPMMLKKPFLVSSKDLRAVAMAK
jgi:hypothetical protein